MMIDDVRNTDAILDAFASAGRVLPVKALKQAAENWAEVAPSLLEMLEAVANGTELTARSESILFFGIYLMAQMREKRAFRHLCAIAAAGDQMEVLIGDGATEDLPLILIRAYDGDPAPLHLLIEAANANEFTRDAGMSALAWLTATGRIDRDETARYLRELHATLQPQEESWVWVGWQQAIANLGLEDLVPLVEAAFEHGWIEEFALGIDDFHDNLRKALQTSDPAEIFHSHDRDDGHLDDAVAHLTPWHAFQPEKKPAPPKLTAPLSRQQPRPAPLSHYGNQPVRNPHRNVGRNDPCPCGSGKKFKKCCLGSAA